MELVAQERIVRKAGSASVRCAWIRRRVAGDLSPGGVAGSMAFLICLVWRLHRRYIQHRTSDALVCAQGRIVNRVPRDGICRFNIRQHPGIKDVQFDPDIVLCGPWPWMCIMPEFFDNAFNLLRCDVPVYEMCDVCVSPRCDFFSVHLIKH